MESAPGERRDGERLRVALALEGELRAEAVEGGQALEFTDDVGRRALRYDHLVVRDGGGRELEARMAVSEEGGEVWLEVDDREAVWPVTIDPTFTQQQNLEASDPAAFDLFGESVAISGETVVVGAPADDGAAGLKARPMSLCAAVESGASSRSSSPRTRRQMTCSATRWRSAGRRSWSARWVMMAQRATIKARPTSLCAVVESGASSRSSSPRTRRQATSSAARWRSAGRRSWSARRLMMAQRATIKARPMSLRAAVESGHSSRSSSPRTRRELTMFGYSVAISGETVVVGALVAAGAAGFRQGSAYVFVRSGGVWTQQQKLEASDAAANDEFGTSVAISGETVVVGAPCDDGAAGINQGSAYVFVRSGGVWTQQQKLLASDAAAFGLFGFSVAISGETVVVGVCLARDNSAYVFARSGGVWSQQQKLEASDAAAFDEFGFSVAISERTVVVGARGHAGAAGSFQGSAYVFGPVPFNFSGFFPPVDNPPAVNVVNAGRAIPVKFSLSGDKGLNIFAAGFPVSQQIACDDGAPESEIEQTVTAGESSLSYDAESDTYTYVWKTEDSWAGTCRLLIVRLNDGSERVAFFKFK